MKKLGIVLFTLIMAFSIVACDGLTPKPVVPTEQEFRRISNALSVIMDFVTTQGEPIVSVEGNTYTVNQNRNHGAGYIIKEGTVVVFDETQMSINADYSLNGGSHTLVIEAEPTGVGDGVNYLKCVFDDVSYDLNAYMEANPEVTE